MPPSLEAQHPGARQPSGEGDVRHAPETDPASAGACLRAAPGTAVHRRIPGPTPEAIETLRQGLEDRLQFFAFRDFDAKKISSTNMRERLHKEIRCRSRVVGIFFSPESYVRLVASYLIEYSENWSTARSYIRAETIEHCRSKLKRVA